MKKFFVFISYNSKDVEWAKWLEHELDFYHLPSDLDPNEKTHHKEKIRDNLRDVFWDSRLAAGGLNDGIKSKLSCSTNLIVICSPNSANVKDHPWVNEEIKYFIELGRLDHIYPFIVDGKEPKEFFPPALLYLPKDKERVGGNVNKDGKDQAFIKIVAGMLDVDVDVLWQHYGKEKAEQERKEREQKEKLQTVVGHYVGEKAIKLVESGDSYLAATLIMEMCNSDMGKVTPEVEKALRLSTFGKSGILRNKDLNKKENKNIECVAVSPDGKKIVSIANQVITIWDSYNGTILDSIPIKDNKSLYGQRKISYINHGNKLVRTFSRGFEIIDSNHLSKPWRIEDTQINGHPIRHLFKEVVFSSNESFAVAATQYDSKPYKKPIIHIIEIQESGFVNKEIIGEGDIPSFDRNEIESLSLAPNDDILAIAIKSGEVYLWSIRDKRHIYTPLQFNQVLFVRFSHDGKFLLIVTNDGYVEVRSMKDFYNIKHFPCNTDNVFSAHFSQDDKQIFICGTNCDNSYYIPTVYIYNIEDGNVETISSIKNKEKITFVNYNEMTKQIISASEDGLIQIWGKEERTTLKDRSFPHITHIEYGNSNTIILATEEKHPVQHIIRNKEGESTITVITVSRNLYLINASNLEQKDIIPISELSRLNRLNVCPEYESIYISDGSCKPFTIKKLNNKWEIVPAYSKFSLNGKYIDTIFVKGENDNVIIYNLYYKNDHFILILSETEEQIGIIPNVLCHDYQYVKQWTVDSKGKYLVVRVAGGFLTVFSLEETNNGLCKEITKLSKSSGGGSLFTPNGKYFISAVNGQNISIWDTEKWTMVSSFNLSTNDKGPQMDISHNSKYLIVGCVSGVYILDIPSGIIVDSIEVKGYVKSVKFNPNGGSIAVLQNDGALYTLSIYLWLSVDELIDNAKERFADRKLSDEEKAKYYM